MLEAALNKMLHAPTAHLRQVVTDKDYESYRVEQLMSSLTELFDLDAEPVSVPSTPSRAAPPLEDAGAERSQRRATGTNGE